jgi:Family of unknown function (DUF5329)
MNRRLWLGCLIAPWGAAAWADPSATERARIERLLDVLAARKDIRFVRNGKEYTGAQAADFLRGKLQWQIEKVATAQDFIVQIGTRSTTSGNVYLVRLGDGRELPSAQFLTQELRYIDKR